MEHPESPSGTSPLTRGELEIELGRLALLLGNAASSDRAFAARRAGRPHPMVQPFLSACAALLARTQPRHRAFVIRRLDRLAAAVDLGIIGLDVWLAEHGDARSTRETSGSRASMPRPATRRPDPKH